MRCYNAVMPMLRKSVPIIGLLIGGATGALLSIIPDPLSLFLWQLFRRPWYLDPWSIMVDTGIGALIGLGLGVGLRKWLSRSRQPSFH